MFNLIFKHDILALWNVKNTVTLRLKNSIYKWEFQCFIIKYKCLCCCFSLCISLFFLLGHGSTGLYMGIVGISVNFLMAWDDVRNSTYTFTI